MVKRRTVSINADSKIDPKIAMKIALEILEGRVRMALTSLEKGHKTTFQGHLNEIRKNAIHVHQLGGLIEPYTSKRLEVILKDAALSDGARVIGDKGDSVITIEGDFDIERLSKFTLW